MTVGAVTTSSKVVFESSLDEPTLAATESSRLSQSTGGIGSDGGSTDWSLYSLGNQQGSSLEKSNRGASPSLPHSTRSQENLSNPGGGVVEREPANPAPRPHYPSPQLPHHPGKPGGESECPASICKIGSSPRTVTPLANKTWRGSGSPWKDTLVGKHSTGTSNPPGALPTSKLICEDSSAVRQPSLVSSQMITTEEALPSGEPDGETAPCTPDTYEPNGIWTRGTI